MGGGPGERDGGGSVEADSAGDGGQLVGWDDGVPGEGGGALPEDGVAGLPAGHVLADGLDDAGRVSAANGHSRAAEREGAAIHESRRTRLPAHHVPVACVESGRLDPHGHLAWSGSRPRHVGEAQDVG